MKRLGKWSLVLLLNLAFALVAFGQTGSITGTLVDAQGGAVAGANVKAVDQNKGVVVREAISGPDGLFILQPLLPGVYTLRISSKGMKDLVQPDLNLDQNQTLGLGSVTMSVGAASETVTVEATTPLVETADSDHSNVIDSKQVTETLLNGRDFQSLMKTLPGVVSNNGSDFQLQFNNTDQMHVNGLRGSANNVFLDGAINTDVGANDGQYTQLSMDAVGEFKVETANFAAEYGRNPGVLIAINTKSGGQSYHGTAYEFNRQDGFGAIPFGQTTSAKLRFNQYGANIGGPIILPKLSPRNNKKMFFFFNYEGTRGLRPGNSQFNSQVISGLGRGYTLPNPNIFAGDFSSQYGTGIECITPDATHPGGPVGSCTGGQTENPNLYQNGQIFHPGTITFTDAGQVYNGTPYVNNQIPVTDFGSQATAWIKYWQQAYLPGTVPLNGTALTANKYFVPFNETYQLNKHQEVLRYDWNINAKTNFFFRWVDDSQQEQYHNLFDFADYPILPEFRKKPGSSWSWNLVNTISPTITNEFIFSYNHLTQVVDILPGTPTSVYDRDALGFTFQQLYPGSNLDNRAPVLNNCCNGTFTGGSFRPGWHSEARQFTWTDNVTKILGNHAIKLGVFFDYNQAGQQPVWDDTVFFQFNTGSGNPRDSANYVANVLFGNFTQAQQTNGVFFGAFRFHQVEAFAQDSWKVNRRLTVDYGLRWAYLGPTYTVQPFFQNYFVPSLYDPAQAVTLNTTPGNYFGAICSAALQALPGGQCPGVTSFGNPYNGIRQENHGLPEGGADHRYNNFGPRLGFAYDVFGNGKTAVRGGFGIFYERIRQNVNSFDALGNPPLSYTATVFNNNVDNLGPQDITGVLSPSGVNAFDKKGQIPTTYGYSLGVQHELPAHFGLEVAYVGNVGRHLQYQYNLNALPVGSVLNTNGENIAFFGPYAGYSNINWTSYSANSSYNSLQVRVIRRFGKSLTATADYVWSKAMDLEDNDNGNINATNGGGNALTDPFNPKRDWARAGYDRKNVFNLNAIYSIPDFLHSGGPIKYLTAGWQVGALWKWWSGVPLDVLLANGPSGSYTGNAGNFVGVVRPNLISGVNPYLGKNNSTWLNPAAFAAPTDGSVGDIGRNSFTGPGINNWDMSIFKNINITEHMYFQLRLEAYNVFNHPQPNNVNVNFAFTSAGSSTFLQTGGVNPGVVNGYRDPRAIQLGGKFYF
jgi:hypothetical protein